MKKIISTLIAAAFFAFAGLCAAADTGNASADKVELLARALGAMRFVPSFKYGLTYQKTHLGVTTPFIEGALHTDDGLLQQIFAGVYARHMSLTQAQALVNFYESPTGQELTAQQTRNPEADNTALKLTPQQWAQAQAFSTSEAGAKMQWLLSSDEVRDEANSAIGSFILGRAVAGRDL